MRLTPRSRLLALAGLALAPMLAAPRLARADLRSVRRAGVMKIATTGTRVPWTYTDSNNRLTGYDIAWGELICADLGLRAEWSKLDFRGMLPGLLAGQYDAVMSGVTITDQRQQTFAFSEPYAYDDTVAVVRADNARVREMADLRGLVVGAGTGSQQESIAKAIPGVREVRSLPGFTDLILNIRTNRIDAMVTSGLAASHYLANTPNSGLRIAGSGVEPAFQGVVLRKGEPEMEEAVSGVIRARKADGTYRRLFQEHFGMDPAR
ncbi:substrate-binding periplasmic protein [Roseomonas sp. F4]